MARLVFGTPPIQERVVAGINYFTCGLAGLIYIILTQSRGQSNFFRFHFLQSIFLGILGLLLNYAVGIAGNILISMSAPFGGSIAQDLGVFITASVEVFRLIMSFAPLLLVYAMVLAFMGKMAEIPLVSDIVRRQL
jgi:uncharacterized membrane protein